MYFGEIRPIRFAMRFISRVKSWIAQNDAMAKYVQQDEAWTRSLHDGQSGG